MTENPRAPLVCLGAFAGAHGVKGDLRVKAFTANPTDVSAYGTVRTEDGAKTFTLKVTKQLKEDFVLVRASEVTSRESAETLKGIRFYVARDALPPPDEDEFYLDDLIGMRAEDETGAPLGHIKAVYNFGADDLLELADIPGIKGVRLAPFTKKCVPDVDLTAGRVVVTREAITIGDNDDAVGD